MSVLDWKNHVSITVDTKEYPALAEARDGQQGTGTFRFTVLGNKNGNQCTLSLENVRIETENKADKALKSLVGDLRNPPEGEVEDESAEDEADLY